MVGPLSAAMADHRPLIEEINAAAFLFLRELSEPCTNTLRIVVEEAVSGPPGGATLPGILPENLRKLMRNARPIVSDATCFAYELIWGTYIAYSIRNESFATGGKAGPADARFLRRCDASPFLEYVAKTTFADDRFPGPFAHWCLSTQNHVVDVASMREPQVRRFKYTG